jgi:hypothetical protein
MAIIGFREKKDDIPPKNELAMLKSVDSHGFKMLPLRLTRISTGSLRPLGGMLPRIGRAHR